MFTVIWSPRALAELRNIIDYVQQFDPQAALRLAERLAHAAESLSVYPLRGRRAGSFRQLSLIYPYRIRYRVQRNRVTILSIRHGARAG